MKLLVITGATSLIGSATAILAAQHGYRVALGYYKNSDLANQIAHHIIQNGGMAASFYVDVTSESSVHDFVLNVNSLMGIPDAVVNAAGGSLYTGQILDTPPKIYNATYELNLFGPFAIIQSCAKLMSKLNGGSGGSIVNISSEATKYGGNNLGAYAAAKAGVNILTVSAAKELASHGIRVNAISPGVIRKDGLLSVDIATDIQLLQSIPLGRFGTGSEVAQAIMWLLSDAASYVTGSILQINGGR